MKNRHHTTHQQVVKLRGSHLAFATLFFITVSVGLVTSAVAKTGDITTIVGTGVAASTGDGGPATEATINNPGDIAIDGRGNLFIFEWGGSVVRRVDVQTGIITTVAGTGAIGFSGDGGPATQASLSQPNGGTVDVAGNVFIADSGNHRVRRVDAQTGLITTVAGTGTPGFSGDGGPATDAELNLPMNVFIDAAGNLFIASGRTNRIRRVDAQTSVITTVAGSGPTGRGIGGFGGDGGPATQARMKFPAYVLVSPAGDLFISDTNNNRVRHVDASGTIATLDSLGGTWDIALDATGNLFITEQATHQVHRVDVQTGEIAIVAGKGGPSFSGDGGPATQAGLNFPLGMVVDA